MNRFICYRQLEGSDCGLACIRMITKYFGQNIPIKYLRSITDMGRVGMTVQDIMDVFKKISIHSLAVKITIQKCLELPLPAILYWQKNHFVVLYKIDTAKRLFYVADPAKGKICYKEEEFKSYWETSSDDPRGVAILGEPLDEFYTQVYEKDNQIRSFFNYILQFLSIHKVSFVVAILITSVIMASDFSIPFLLRKTIDDGIASKDIGLVWILLLGQLSLAIGGLVGAGIVELIMTKTGLRIHLDMVRKFLDRLSRFPLSFFDHKVSSDFVQKIHDHQRIKSFLLDFPSSTLLISLSLFVFSILLFHYSPVIFIFYIVMSLLELTWNYFFINRRKALDYTFFNLSSANSNHAYELTNGMADLKVNNAERTKIEKWNETQEKLNDTSIKSAWLSKIQGSGHSILARIKDLSVTGIAAGLVISEDMSLGTLMTLSYITGRLGQPFHTLNNSFDSLQSAMLSFQRIEDVVGEEPQWRGKGKFTSPRVTFNNVGFKYAGSYSPYVLNNIDLVIEECQTTAIVGESGCGKSTLIKLILGFYIPHKGSLVLGDCEVKDLDNYDWLAHCGVVMQEAKIFSGSVMENIALSDVNPSIEKVKDTIATVGLTEFIDSLPMGLDTKLGVSGIELSGGQKQRLMIARALYKDPDLLVLDEATSSLDANNEKRIVENICQFGKNRTVVIAAHRLSTIQNADKIVFMKDGHISEIGTHVELLKNKGDYWELVQNQLSLTFSD